MSSADAENLYRFARPSASRQTGAPLSHDFQRPSASCAMRYQTRFGCRIGLRVDRRWIGCNDQHEVSFPSRLTIRCHCRSFGKITVIVLSRSGGSSPTETRTNGVRARSKSPRSRVPFHRLYGMKPMTATPAITMTKATAVRIVGVVFICQLCPTTAIAFLEPSAIGPVAYF